MRRTASVLAAAALVATAGPAAHAGGMFLPARGVVPTSQGGAVTARVAGAEALGANPAGLLGLEHGGHFQLDVGFVDQSVSYTRIDSGFNPQAQVTDSAGGKVVPSLALAFRHSDRLAWGVALYAPFGGLGSYPEDGPQRYSLVDMSHTVLLTLEGAVAYQVTPRLRIGVALRNLSSFVSSRIVFSGCPQETVCAPEDPEFDSYGEVQQKDWLNLSGSLGAQLQLAPAWSLGLAVELPTRISGGGELAVRLPSNGFFDNATVVGDSADVRFTLPGSVRAGIAYRPSRRLALELDVSYEPWSLHNDIEIDPDDITIEGTPGVGDYQVSDVAVPRRFDDSFGVGVGLDAQPSRAVPLRLRAGYAFETAAAPDEYLSIMTVDGTRHMLGFGAAWRARSWEVYAGGAYVLVADRTVTPEVGRSPQLSPIRTDNLEAPVTAYVNWGDYTSSWLVLGAGFAVAF